MAGTKRRGGKGQKTARKKATTTSKRSGPVMEEIDAGYPEEVAVGPDAPPEEDEDSDDDDKEEEAPRAKQVHSKKRTVEEDDDDYDEDGSSDAAKHSGEASYTTATATGTSKESSKDTITALTMSGISNAQQVGLSKSRATSGELIKRACAYVRHDLFEAMPFYPTKKYWNIDGAFGKKIALVVLKCDVSKQDTEQDRSKIIKWKGWYVRHCAAAIFQSAHSTRRRNVSSEIAKAFGAQVVATKEYHEGWLEKVMEMRVHESYGDILNMFAPKVVRRSWHTKKTSMLVSDIMTVASEAFMLLVLENVADHIVRKHEIRAARAAAKKDPNATITIPSEIKKRYQDGTAKSNEGNGEWTRAGLVRYKELCQHVQSSRASATGRAFDIDFRQSMVDALEKAAGNGEDNEGVVVEDDELWADWDEALGGGLGIMETSSVPKADLADCVLPESQEAV